MTIQEAIQVRHSVLHDNNRVEAKPNYLLIR